VRWDRQLERKLVGYLGTAAVRVEVVEDVERAIAP
jgi:hypothetical protein